MLCQLIMANTLLVIIGLLAVHCVQFCSIVHITKSLRSFSGSVRLRFKTDADKAGTEKLVVSAINTTLLTKPHMRLRVQDISGAKCKVSTLQPMDVFLVKGWTRTVAAVACLLHGFAEPDSFEASFLN